jgi:SpoIID/LytB domain
MKIAAKNRFSLILIAILLFIAALFILLYNTYIIFVKNVEHGVIVNKVDQGKNFRYEVYVDGKQYFFNTRDKTMDLNTGVANFKYRNGTIVKFTGYVQPVNEKIMSRASSSIELEYSGKMNLSKGASVYKMSEKSISPGSLYSILVGAKNINVYKDKTGKIKTIIMNGETVTDTIRVGIKNQGFQSFQHDRLEFVSPGNIKMEDKRDNKSINVSPGVKITVTPSNNDIMVQTGSENYSFKNRVYISSQDRGSMINVQSFSRGYGQPSYRGFFEITCTSGKLELINEVDLENYLYQVVPSEMPSSFGLEALKAQAVAARTYALSDLYSGRYAAEGFHVDDSTMSQVYNNSKENSITTQAINESRGLVMKYDGSLVDAKYYSTSHGYGANSSEIWSDNGKFPGTDKPYLDVENYLVNKEKYDLSSEKDAEAFFKNWNLKSYDSNSPYFRWKCTLSRDELKNTIEKNLPITYQDQKNYILTLINNTFESRDIPQNCLGDLTDIKVTKRGQGGNIMELTIWGTKGTYKVIKELNVRYVLRPRKSDTGSDNDILIKRIKGDDLKNNSLLPSAFMVLDIARDNANAIKSVTFYGGGYGHGVGMSQYGAGYLSSKGYTFDKILNIYYKGINLEKEY